MLPSQNMENPQGKKKIKKGFRIRCMDVLRHLVEFFFFFFLLMFTYFGLKNWVMNN